jgi:hypothetical protein
VSEHLDPLKVNNDGEHKDKNIREALDSDEHPESLPIAVMFDVTGSMGAIPRTLQEKLPNLYGMLIRKGYVEHPQVLFGAIGDAYCDRSPLQVGQFESDNRADEQLEEIYLEGGGGGGNHESYELAMYFMARHTYTDAWEKRQKRGYLFIIGDERVYSSVNPSQVKQHVGDDLNEALTTESLVEELKEKWDVYYLFAEQGSYGEGDVLDPSLPAKGHWGSNKDDQVCYWRDLLGQNAVKLEDGAAVCETIALAVGVGEGAVTLEDGVDDLTEVTGDAAASKAAGKALAAVGGGGAVATTEGELPDDEPDEAKDEDGGTERL